MTANLITSVEQFHSVILDTLFRAQDNLKRDGNVIAIALFEGRRLHAEVHLSKLPVNFWNVTIRAMVKARRELEYVLLVAPGKFVIGDELPEWHEVLQLPTAIGVEGSHPDFGAYAAYTEIHRAGERWMFSDPQTGVLSETAALAELWPTRRLNS